MSWDIPNYVTLGAEIAVGLGIALYIHRLQSKTGKIRDDVTNQIKKYTDEQRKHQEIRKKFYIKRIKQILELIKAQDIELKDMIADFKQAPKNPDMHKLLYLEGQRDRLETMCANAEKYLEFLEPLLIDPQIQEEIMGYLVELYTPFKFLSEQKYWVQSLEVVKLAEKTLDLHLREIDGYLDLLSKEEATGVTDPTSQQPAIH